MYKNIIIVPFLFCLLLMSCSSTQQDNIQKQDELVIDGVWATTGFILDEMEEFEEQIDVKEEKLQTIRDSIKKDCDKLYTKYKDKNSKNSLLYYSAMLTVIENGLKTYKLVFDCHVNDEYKSFLLEELYVTFRQLLEIDLLVRK